MTPQDPEHGAIAKRALFAGFSALVGILPLIAIAQTGPKYAEIFRDFGTPMPIITRTLLDFAEFIAHPAALITAFLAIAGVGAMVHVAARRNVLVMIMWWLIVVGYGALLIIFYMWMMFVPLNDLIQSLKGNAV